MKSPDQPLTLLLFADAAAIGEEGEMEREKIRGEELRRA